MASQMEGRMLSGSRLAFSSEQLILCGSLVVYAIKGEAKLFGLILWVWDLNNIGLLRAIFCFGVDDDVLLELGIEEWPYSCDHAN